MPPIKYRNFSPNADSSLVGLTTGKITILRGSHTEVHRQLHINNFTTSILGFKNSTFHERPLYHVITQIAMAGFLKTGFVKYAYAVFQH